MMRRIDWPMALVVCVLAAVAGGLEYTDKLPATWEAGVGALFVLIAGGLRSYLGGTDAPPSK